MKHAGAVALDRLEDLLEAVRALGVLNEKNRGVFYRRSRAALHFHEDPAGLFADFRAGDGTEFERIKVDEPRGQAALLDRLAKIS
jgi:hypothetical protein